MGDTIEVKNSGTTKLEVVGMDNMKTTLSIPDTIKNENTRRYLKGIRLI